MNAVWHERHPMPRNATVEQRITWHLAHQEHCGCRPIPAGLLEKMPSKRAPRSRSPSTKRAGPPARELRKPITASRGKRS